MTFKTILGAVAACFAFSGAAQALVEYDCGFLNGHAVNASLYDEEEIVDVRHFVNGSPQSYRLSLSSSGSYIVPHDNIEFFAQGNQASLNLWGAQVSCVAVAFQDPGGPLTAINNGGGGFVQPQNAPAPPGSFYGRSLGGNLRAGPGMHFADVGSTFNGMEIIMVQNSGVVMNGYPWWLVQSTDGIQSYQWGGLLCVPGQAVQGLYHC